MGDSLGYSTELIFQNSGSMQYTVQSISSSIVLISSQTGTIFFCSGTITLTLPSAAGLAGISFTFINIGTGVITIAGTVNGNALGYQLVNQFQDIEIVSDGVNWYAKANN